MKSILLFGTFDGIHAGHRHMFEQAKNVAPHVIVAVAPDSVVSELKGRAPKHTAQQRIESLQSEPSVDEVTLGDLDLGSWGIVDATSPTYIGIGYDQMQLGEEIRSWINQNHPSIEVVRLEPHDPHINKSSLLNKSV